MCRAWSGPAFCAGWTLSAMYLSFSPLSPNHWSLEGRRERRVRVSSAEGCSKRRSAPAQDGGGVAAAQGRGAQPQTHA